MWSIPTGPLLQASTGGGQAVQGSCLAAARQRRQLRRRVRSFGRREELQGQLQGLDGPGLRKAMGG